MAYFPMMVDLSGKSVLVVGGGETALRKARQLISFGAVCHVIAPATDEDFSRLDCTIERRCYQDGDIERLQPLATVVAATDDHELNHEIGERCRKLNIMVNVADDPELSTFIFPAVVRRGDIVCGITSGTGSPLVSQYLRKLTEDVIPEGINEINEEMGRYKQELLKSEPDIRKRRAMLKARFDELMRQ